MADESSRGTAAVLREHPIGSDRWRERTGGWGRPGDDACEERGGRLGESGPGGRQHERQWVVDADIWPAGEGPCRLMEVCTFSMVIPSRSKPASVR